MIRRALLLLLVFAVPVFADEREPFELPLVHIEADRLPGIQPPDPRPDLPPMVRVLLDAPSETTAFLIDHQNDGTFVRRSSVIDVPADVARRVAELLLSRQNENHHKACIIRYNVKYAYEYDGGRVEATLCLSCGIAMYLTSEGPGGGHHTDGVTGELVKLTHALFPADAEIGKIHARRLVNEEDRRVRAAAREAK